MQAPAPSEVKTELQIPEKLVPPIDVSRVKNEKDVKKLIKALLNAHGWFTWMPGANGYGTQGVLDHMAIKDGAFLVVEAKFGYNKPKATQKAFAAQVLANDCMAVCVNEKSIDHFSWFLTSFHFAQMAQMKGEEVPEEHGARMMNALTVLMEPWR